MFCVACLNAQTSAYDKLTDDGLALLEKNMPNDAIKKYEMALQIDTKRVEAYYGLGIANYLLCRKNAENCVEAIKFLDIAIKIDSSYRKGYYNRGCCKALISDFPGALEDFNKAIALDNRNGYYYYNRSFIKLSLGDKNGACIDIKLSSKLGFIGADSKLNEICN